MVRPKRKTRLPTRLINEETQSVDKPIHENSRPEIEHVDNTNIQQRKILKRSKRSRALNEQRTELMFRMLRRTVGTLAAKMNVLTEEIKITKFTAGNGTGSSENNDELLPRADVTTIVQNNVKEVTGERRSESDIQDNLNTERVEISKSRAEQECKNIIYNIQNINLDKPKFGGKPDIHPVTFLEDLEIYLKKAGSNGKEIELILECLVGETRDWARIYKERWREVNDFKIDFLATYWGDREQNELRRAIVQSQWDRIKSPSMQNHFMQLVGKAQMLSYKIPEKQLVADIIRHFPKYIQQGWMTSKIENIIETAEYLRNMDNINKQEAQQTSTVTGQKATEKRKIDYQRGYENWKRPRVNNIQAETRAPAVAREEVVNVVEDIALN